jgi:hypothetical protein
MKKMLRIFFEKRDRKGDEKGIKLSLEDKTFPGFSIPIPSQTFPLLSPIVYPYPFFDSLT